MKKQASYPTKQVYVQIEYLSWGLHKPMKVCYEMEKEEEEEKNDTLNNNFIERKDFITRYQRNSSVNFGLQYM